jgi:hypothetical protein
LMSILLKLEKDIVVKNSKIILLLLVVIDVVFNSIVLFYFNTSDIIDFILFECSDLLLICCWHFSLSLYKRLKVIFVVSGLSSFVFKFIMWFNLGEIFLVFAFLMPTLILGLLLIISAELLMKRKGILNYI